MKTHLGNQFLIAAALGLFLSSLQAAEKPMVQFKREPGRLVIVIGDERFGAYVYQDAGRNRIYYRNVQAPGGIQVTVPQPLGPGDDDHGGYHPGIWISYGDLNGNDYWRKKDAHVHDEFVKEPHGEPGRGRFTVRNRYLDGQDGPVLCDETVEHTILVRPGGYLLLIDARYRSPETDLVFGDQQEMGLGVRVNTPLNVEENGRMLDSEGRVNEKEIWGRQADWCDYSGPLEGRWAGMTLFGHPDNFRQCRFHARDYGCLVANPFGRADFDQGQESRVTVKRGDTLRLRWGIFIHSNKQKGDFDPETVYADYLKLTSESGD